MYVTKPFTDCLLAEDSEGNSSYKKKVLDLSINVSCMKVFIVDTTFTSPSGDGTDIFRSYPSHAKEMKEVLSFPGYFKTLVLVWPRKSNPWRPAVLQSRAIPTLVPRVFSLRKREGEDPENEVGALPRENNSQRRERSVQPLGILRVVPILRDSRASERERPWKSTHERKARRGGETREKNVRTTHKVKSLGFVCSSSLFSLTATSRLSRVGWFSCALAFRSLQV